MGYSRQDQGLFLIRFLKLRLQDYLPCPKRANHQLLILAWILLMLQIQAKLSLSLSLKLKVSSNQLNLQLSLQQDLILSQNQIQPSTPAPVLPAVRTPVQYYLQMQSLQTPGFLLKILSRMIMKTLSPQALLRILRIPNLHLIQIRILKSSN